MKTTFDIDETVMKELREEATRRGVPVSALVESGLRHLLIEEKSTDGQARHGDTLLFISVDSMLQAP